MFMNKCWVVCTRTWEMISRDCRLTWEASPPTSRAPSTWRTTSASSATARSEWLLLQTYWPLLRIGSTGFTRYIFALTCKRTHSLWKFYSRTLNAQCRPVWGRLQRDEHCWSQVQQQHHLGQRHLRDCPNRLHIHFIWEQAHLGFNSSTGTSTSEILKWKMSYRGKRPGGGLETEIEKAREEGGESPLGLFKLLLPWWF